MERQYRKLKSKTKFDIKKTPLYKLQSEETELENISDDFIHRLIDGCSMFHRIEHKQKKDARNFMLKLVTDSLLLTHSLSRSETITDVLMAFAKFISGCCDSSVFDKISEILIFIEGELKNFFLPQSDSPFKPFRDILNKFEELKVSPIFQKLYKLMMYAMSFSIFQGAGLTMSTFGFSELYQESIRSKYHMGLDFVQCILDTSLFLLERGYQCIKTGSLDPIYHGSSSYDKWFDTTRKLKRDAVNLNDPEAHGLDVFSFVADLNSAIEKGESIYKHSCRLGKTEKNLIGSILDSLKIIKSDYLTKRSAMQERKAPFSVLIFGGSSVGKSTFTKLLFYHFGKLFDLDTSSEFKYTRNAANPFFSNFTSAQWCLELDDIAMLKPSGGEVDPSLLEVISIVNNVPYVPPQADLADKGRTPLRCKLVIATTNTEHLNAFDYFSCPLAVRRRFPYIIEIMPKREYLKDGLMLDSSKATWKEGSYPDLWIITIKKVVAAGQNRAKTEEVEVFSDINLFIEWFSVTAVDFEAVQNKVRDCDNAMSKIKICKKCFLPCDHCTCLTDAVEFGDPTSHFINQSLAVDIVKDCYDTAVSKYISDEEYNINSLRLKEKFSIIMYYIYIRFFLIKVIIDLIFGHDCVSRWIYNRLTYKQFAKMVMFSLGQNVQKKIGMNPLYVYISVGFAAIATAVRMFNFAQKMCNNSTEVNKDKTGVWCKHEFRLSDLDISRSSQCIKKNDTLASNIGDNLCLLKITTSEGKLRTVRATCLRGNMYITNNHAIPTGSFCVQFINSPLEKGLSKNFEMVLTPADIHRVPGTDICLLKLIHVPPKRDIIRYFCKSFLQVKSNSYLIQRSLEGEVKDLDFKSSEPQSNYYYDMLKISFDAYLSYSSSPTINGDCGSLLVMKTDIGHAIVGFHIAGSEGKDYFGLGSYKTLTVGLTQERLLALLSNFSAETVVASTPAISNHMRSYTLNSLDSRSPTRYVEEGACNVFGSLSGFRRKPVSKVVATSITEEATKRGYISNKVKPDLYSWKPWYRALNDLTPTQSLFSSEIVYVCAASFLHDILSALGNISLKPISMFQAINGIPGCLYIDGINRNTSCGFPYNVSKKQVLVNCPSEIYPDGVDIPQEMKKEVWAIINKYLRGERACPIYNAALKDEAISEEKNEIGKVRVYCGAPFVWSIVVRMYLMCVVKLIQENRFVFECAAGTIAQSPEWTILCNYLTKFGADRLIAGDYKNFDKGMSALLVRTAFNLIIEICKAGGFSEEDIKIVEGIAVDTTYAYVNFHGDLVELFQGNPSGHPLTVIINSLVNSIYIRYSYFLLNPDKEVSSFKQNVNLSTYGDDNIMGVSYSIPWFNHTSISETLSKFGITYTMADKVSVSKPYCNLDEITFLKRSFVWDEDLSNYACPLEEESLFKTLNICVRSPIVTLEHQTVDAMSSVCREYFFYGRKMFNEKREDLLDIAKTCDLGIYIQPNSFPQYDELLSQYQSREYFKIQSSDEESDEIWSSDSEEEFVNEDIIDYREPECEEIAENFRRNCYLNLYCHCDNEVDCCLYQNDDFYSALNGVLDEKFWKSFFLTCAILNGIWEDIDTDMEEYYTFTSSYPKHVCVKIAQICTFDRCWEMYSTSCTMVGNEPCVSRQRAKEIFFDLLDNV